MNRLPPATGRGACSNPVGRFERRWSERVADEDVEGDEDEGEDEDEDGVSQKSEPATVVTELHCRSIITRNDSPDVPFDRSINPYNGCEHGCVYCFARPTHGYHGLSSGLDFETRIFAKQDAAALLRAELSRPSYRCLPIALGASTDPYQPVDRRLGITRAIIEVLRERHHPVGIITKSAGVLRDLPLLAEMAALRLAHVFISVTTLDPGLARRLEPRASSPKRRLSAIEALAKGGVPVGVLASPMIPALNDCELERILAACRDAGATRAGTSLVRLPHEVKELLSDWLLRHYPDKKEHVLARIREARDGALNDPRFGSRMRGHGQYAEMLRARFEVAARRLGYERSPYPFDTARFRRPEGSPRQLPLFGG